jgi:hypothetical protein
MQLLLIIDHRCPSIINHHSILFELAAAGASGRVATRLVKVNVALPSSPIAIDTIFHHPFSS